MWQPATRYPDPAVQSLDPAFDKYKVTLAAVERLATGFRWAEGPVWFGDGRYLLWSDIPNNRIMKWEEETGAVSVFRKPSHNANGNTRDRQGRLVTCEHDARRVTRTEHDGTITVVCDRFDGKPLNSPNDVVVRSDGTIWFTDPSYGFLQGFRPEPQLGDFVLWESNAIMWFLCERHGATPLWPSDPQARAAIAKWQLWQAAHLSPAADGLMYENLVRPIVFRR